MKGVVLGGGIGTRLRPVTLYTDKLLVPVFDRPMVYYPLETLKNLGVDNIRLVTSERNHEQLRKALGDGSDRGISLSYSIQAQPKGMAHALFQAKDHFSGEKVVAICGDLIFESAINVPEEAFDDGNAYIFLYRMEKPKGVGVPVFDSNGRIVKIEEKPAAPKSDYVVTGLYIFPPDVFDFIATQKPSQRGELEITDVIDWYIGAGRLKHIEVDSWSDVGTFESLLRTSVRIARRKGIVINVE